MSESGITKKALAASFKELMKAKAFEKIRISDICDGCDLNRKSFYYHFKDKYDLLNWIFDTEIEAVYRNLDHTPDVADFESLRVLCRYLYENIDFYRRAIRIQGQNSFSEHFTDRLKPAIRKKLKDIMGDDLNEFHVMFFSDAFLCSMGRWLSDRNCMPPDDFVDMLASCIWQTAVKVYTDTGYSRQR